ncbi:MAG: hypothetical protein ISN29_09385 [Gammaproteobacteria bacterium AqS3]|nr:hypothetical protein [Gammaproteobacteria bacterium AqS3]
MNFDGSLRFREGWPQRLAGLPPVSKMLKKAGGCLTAAVLLIGLAALAGQSPTASAQSLPAVNSCFRINQSVDNGVSTTGFTNDCTRSVKVSGYRGAAGESFGPITVDAGGTYPGTNLSNVHACFEYYYADDTFSPYETCPRGVSNYPTRDKSFGEFFSAVTRRSKTLLPYVSEYHEDSRATIPVRLWTFPDDNVTVTVQYYVPDDQRNRLRLDNDPNTPGDQNPALTFTAANWDRYQDVHLVFIPDDDAVQDNTKIGYTITGGGFTASGGQISNLTVRERNTVSLVTSPTTLDVAQGGTGAFTVKLGVKPKASVTVTIAQPASSTGVSVDTTPGSSGNSNTLRFTPESWNAEQAVRVLATGSAPVQSGAATLSLSGRLTPVRSSTVSDVTGSVAVNVGNANNQLLLSTTQLLITEAQSRTFDVRLASQPSSDVTVAIRVQPSSAGVTVDTDSDTAGSQTELVFTGSNWNDNQTVTVSAAHDDDRSDHLATITFTTSGSGAPSASGAQVSVIVEDDDDSIGSELPANCVSGNYITGQPVILTNHCRDQVKVTGYYWTGNTVTTLPSSKRRINSGASVEYDYDTISLCVDYNDANVQRQTGYSPCPTLSNANYSRPSRAWRVRFPSTITNHGRVPAALKLSVSSFTLVEGESGQFNIALALPPASGSANNVTVTIPQPLNSTVRFDTDPSRSGDQNTLTFTSDNWSLPQRVYVRSSEDDDAAEISETITLSASGGGSGNTSYANVTGSLALRVTETDTASLDISSTSLTVGQGNTDGFSVRLGAKPVSNVTLTIPQPAASTGVTIDTEPGMIDDQNTLTFTPRNWNLARAVRVSASDTAPVQNSAATLSLTASGSAEYSSMTGSVSISVGNMFSQLMVTPAGLALIEGEKRAFTVSLASRPLGDVRVSMSLSPSDTDVMIDADPVENDAQVELTLNDSNWNTGQMVTVLAGHDSDQDDDAATISFSAVGRNAPSGMGTEVSVIVTDDDFDPMPRLPADCVTIAAGNLRNTCPEEMAIEGYSASSNNQTQRITGANASIPGGGSRSIATQGVHACIQYRDAALQSATGYGSCPDAGNSGNYSLSAPDAAPIIYFPSTRPTNLGGPIRAGAGLKLSLTSITLVEGESNEFNVSLTSPPASGSANNVTVTIPQPSDGSVKFDTNTSQSGDQNTLTFTSDNWSRPQSVRVTTRADGDALPVSETITLTASGGGSGNSSYAGVTRNLTLRVTETHRAGLIVNPEDLQAPKNSNSTFTVRLTALPSANVTVNVSEPTGFVIDTDGTSGGARPKQLTFTTDNWSDPQTVLLFPTLSAPLGNNVATVNLSASGAGEYAGVTGSMTVDVGEAPSAVSVGPQNMLTVTEGQKGSFYVVLTRQPTGDVRVRLRRTSGNSKVFADADPLQQGTQGTLIFTRDNWAIRQTVSVFVDHDDDANPPDPATAELTLTPSGGGVDTQAPIVVVTVREDDFEATPSASTCFTVPGSSTGNFENSCAHAVKFVGSYIIPSTGNVSQFSLTWAPGSTGAIYPNANACIQYRDDSIQRDTGFGLCPARTNQNYTPTDPPTYYFPSTRPTNLGGPIRATAGFRDLPSTFTVDEGETGQLNVRLTTPPGDDVTVTLAQPAASTGVNVYTGKAAGGQNTLTFTDDNWGTTQTFFIETEDDDTADQQANVTLSFSASGGGGTNGISYAGVSDTVTLVVREKNAADFVLSTGDTGLDLIKGGSNTFTVRLASKPTANLTATLVQPPASTGVTLDTDPDTDDDQNTLAFTTGNWNAAQTVTVSAAGNAPVNNNVNIALSAAGAAEYASATGSVIVAVREPDVTLVLSKTSVDVAEGGQGSFTVRLSERPAGSVTLTATQPSNTDVTVDVDDEVKGDQTTLTFTRDNWDTARTVTVAAAHDADEFSDSATVALAITGDSVQVGVSVTDDDFSSVGESLSELGCLSHEIKRESGGRLDMKLDNNCTRTVYYKGYVTGHSRIPNRSLNASLKPGASVQFAAVYGRVCAQFSDEEQRNSGYGTCPYGQYSNYNEPSFPTPPVFALPAKLSAGFRDLPSSITVAEGSTGQFSVRLTTSPRQNAGDANVMVTIAQPAASTGLRVDTDPSTPGDQNTLTFSGDNWSTTQSVYVRSTDDDDAVMQPDVRLDLSASGGGSGDYSYAGATGSVDVSVQESDRALFVLSAERVTVSQGQIATFSVRLSSQPSETVTATLAQPSAAAGVMIDTAPSMSGLDNTLTFTRNNWNAVQNVTVLAEADAIAGSNVAVVALSTSGADEYADTTASLSVSVEESSLAVQISPRRLTVQEGGTATFTIRTSAPPSQQASSTVAWSTPAGADVTVLAAGGDEEVTINQTNWSTEQVVTVSAPHDSDGLDERIFLRFSGTNELAGINGAIDIIVEDDEDYSITVSPDEWVMSEGTVLRGSGGQSTTTQLDGVRISLSEAGNFQLHLDPHPANPALLKVGDDDDGVLLSFSSANATTPRSLKELASAGGGASSAVILEALDDSNTADETYTLTIRGRDSFAGAGSFSGISREVKLTVLDDDIGVVDVSTESLTLTEGDTTDSTLMVRLRNQPSANTSVQVELEDDANQGTAPTLVSASGTLSLTFTTDNWSRPQSVGIAVAEDTDLLDYQGTIKLTASNSSNDTFRDGEVRLIVQDNDDIELAVSEDELTIEEGDFATFTIQLEDDPGGDRTVMLESSNSDVTFRPASLKFDRDDWDDPQTVRISVAQDSDTEDETAEVDITGDRLESASLTVTISDDENFPLTLSRAALNLTEGTSENFTVSYDEDPGSSGVTFALSSNDSASAITISPTTLTFTSGNWETPQTVTLTAAEDADEEDASERIDLTLSAVASASAVASVEVSIFDNDGTPMTATPTTLALAEGADGTFTVRPQSDPGGSLTVNVTSDNADVTVDTDAVAAGSQTSLTFDSSNWTTARTVSVTAGHDADRSNDTANVVVNAIGAVAAIVVVSVTDDDPLGLELSASSVDIVEEGTESITVRLDKQPSDTVVIGFTADSADLTFESGNPMTFNSGNWSVMQTLTFSAARDSDMTDDSISVTAACDTGRSDDCTGVSGDSFTVEVDEVVKPVLSDEELQIREGQSATFMVRLDQQPAGNVNAIYNLRTDSSAIDLNPGSLEFTSANWGDDQPITITTTEDATKDDAGTEIRLEGTDGRSAGASISLQLYDDDIGLTAPARLTVSEDDSEVFNVVMDTEPLWGRTVNLRSDSSAVTVTNAQSATQSTTLTFTPDDWNVAQGVQVSAARDNNSANETATVTLGEANGYLQSASVGVTVEDNYSRLIIVEPTEIDAPEGETLVSSSEFPLTVRLSDRPSGNVRVRLVEAADNPAGLTIGPRGNGITMNFSPSDWETPKSFSLGGVNTIRLSEENADSQDTDYDLIVQNETGSGLVDDYEGAVSETVTLTVLDNDASRPVLPSAAVAVSEGGTAEFGIRLDRSPGAAGLTVTLTQPSNTDVTIDTDPGTPGDQLTLNFTASTFGTPQAVTVTAGQDDDALDDMAEIGISPFALSAGARDDSISVIVDDDEVGFVLSSDALMVDEGASTNFSVALSRSPGSDKTVTLGTAHPDLTLSSTTLEFTSGNWSTAQSVTLNVAQDPDAADETAEISFSAQDVVGRSLPVSIDDDEVLGIITTGGPLEIEEGQNGTFTVRLSQDPSLDTTVLLQSDNTEVTISPTTLDFTSANWQTPRTVTVTTVEDEDALEDKAQISLTAEGSGALPSALSVTVLDNDGVNLVFTGTPVTVQEGGLKEFTVVLDANPTVTTLMRFDVSGDADVRIDRRSYAFGAANWNQPITITVSAANDSDTDNDTAEILFTGPGVGERRVSVTVEDKDSLAFVVEAPQSPLELDEGASKEFEVRLSARPPGDINVVLVSDNSDITLTPAALSFDVNNWQANQSVRVIAGQDNDAGPDSATISLTADGVADASLSVEVEDDEANTLDLVVSRASVLVEEGATATFTVALNTSYGESDFVVTLAQPEASQNSDVTFSPTELTFAGDSWNTPQTVTVTAAQDDNAVDDEATIVLTAPDPVQSERVIVSVDDDETQGVVANPESVSISEGEQGTFGVRLVIDPGVDTSVSLIVSDPSIVTADTDADTPGNQITLDFTAGDDGNWNRLQTVTVTAASDDDAADESAIIRLIAASEGVAPFEVEISVDDTDVLGFNLPEQPSNSPLPQITEGTQQTFDVSLSLDPGVTKTVTVEPSTPSITVSPTTLTFTPDNWDAEQTITITAPEDADASGDTVSINLTAPGVESGVYSVEVVDNDSTFVVEPGSPSVNEGGTSSFTVALSLQPAGNQRATLRSGSSKFDFSPTSLRFTTDNWNQPQRITVNGLEDNDAENDSGTIELSASGVVDSEVIVEVVDDEVAFVLEPSRVPVKEGATASFQVRLNRFPGSDQSVTLTPSNSKITVSPDSAEFTTSNWNVLQRFTITSIADDDSQDENLVVDLSASGVLGASLLVSVEDNDTAGITTSEDTLLLNEGESQTFNVVLTAEPTGDVTVSLSSSDPSVSALPLSLVFDAGNWNRPQTVTVTAVDDDDAVDPGRVTITLSAAGGGFDGESSEVSVTVTDNDERGLDLPEDAVSVREEGAPATFAAKLKTRPSEEVILTFVQPENTDVTVDTDTVADGLQNTLTFTTDNWNTEQMVTVLAGHDDDAVNDTATINVTASGGDYSFDVSGQISVEVTDDDIADITLIGTGGVNLYEGQIAYFSVQLTTLPSTDIEIRIASDDEFAVSTSSGAVGNPESVDSYIIEFTDSNWNIPQRVQLSAARDADRNDEEVIITVSAQGAEYSGVSKRFRVTVKDDDASARPERERQAAKLVLAEIASAIHSSTSDAISLRFDSSRDERSATVAGHQIALDRSLTSDLAAGFAGRAGAQDTSLGRFADDRFGADRFGSDWLGGVPLQDGRPLRSGDTGGGSGPNRAALLSSFSYAITPLPLGGGNPGWSIWGRADSREFSGIVDGIDYDGMQTNAWIGFDRRADSGILFGLAFSSANGDADYTLDSFNASLETNMSTVLPYIEVTTDTGASGRMMLGIGNGEVTLNQTDGLEGTADLTMQLVSIGGRWPAARLEDSTLSWSGDFGFNILQTPKATDAEIEAAAVDAGNVLLDSLDDLNVRNIRVRGGLELVHNGMGETWKAAPRIGLLVRHDAGDGVTGTGVELVAGLQMRSAAERFSIDFNVRALGAHTSEELTDWGAGLMLRMSSRNDGEGLEFAVGPHWGDINDDLLEREEAFKLDESDIRRRQLNRQTRGMSANIAYGLRTFGGMLTPYSEYRFTSGESGQTNQVTGLRYIGREALELRLFSERQISARGESQSKLGLELNKRF